jgi:hypothetical protein
VIRRPMWRRRLPSTGPSPRGGPFVTVARLRLSMQRIAAVRGGASFRRLPGCVDPPRAIRPPLRQRLPSPTTPSHLRCCAPQAGPHQFARGLFFDLARSRAALSFAWFCGLRASSYSLLAMAIAAALRISFMRPEYPALAVSNPGAEFDLGRDGPADLTPGARSEWHPWRARHVAARSAHAIRSGSRKFVGHRRWQ